MRRRLKPTWSPGHARRPSTGPFPARAARLTHRRRPDSYVRSLFAPLPRQHMQLSPALLEDSPSFQSQRAQLQGPARASLFRGNLAGPSLTSPEHYPAQVPRQAT